MIKIIKIQSFSNLKFRYICRLYFYDTYIMAAFGRKNKFRPDSNDSLQCEIREELNINCYTREVKNWTISVSFLVFQEKFILKKQTILFTQFY